MGFPIPGAVQIKDGLDVVVNPATEDKQDEIISAIGTGVVGGATETKQDDQITIANTLSTEAKQDTAITAIEAIPDGVKIKDDSDNIIDSSVDANGDYHLDTAVIQKIISSTNNYTDANLASGATFTGTADETFGTNGIQVFHTADQDCTVYIDQSTDSTFADSTKTFTTTTACLANEACTRVIVSVAPYYRLRVTNTDLSGVTTTKLETATGMTPIISTLPTELSTRGNLQVVASLRGDQNYDRHAWISPTSTLSVNELSRLVGTNFDGTTKDTSFWTETVTNGGSVTQTGEIKLLTNTTANGTAQYDSVRNARFVVGSAMQFTGAFKFNDALVTDNIRRCGAYDDDEGFFFELDGETFNIGSRKTGSDTLVASGDFNGNLGPNFTPNPAVYYKLDIEWTPLGAFYYVNNKLLHKSVGGHLTRRLSNPIRFENNNTNGVTTAVVMDCLGAVISRLGQLATAPTSSFTLGVDAGKTLKVGAGVLHRINNLDNQGTMTIYDNTAASGTQLAIIDCTKTIGTIEFGITFNNGLTIVTTDAQHSSVVVYE